jgi:hypothetical protein
MDGWRGMLLDDVPNWEGTPWAPFPTGLVGLSLSWENKCIIVNIMYLQVI